MNLKTCTLTDDFDHAGMPHLGILDADKREVIGTTVDEPTRALFIAAPRMLQALRFACEVLERPPERNCSCHLHPPCGDCFDYGAARDAWEEIDAAIAAAEPGDKS